ncbi:hypothetical protein D3C84_1153890 [compost metagenome]
MEVARADAKMSRDSSRGEVWVWIVFQNESFNPRSELGVMFVRHFDVCDQSAHGAELVGKYESRQWSGFQAGIGKRCQ